MSHIIKVTAFVDNNFKLSVTTETNHAFNFEECVKALKIIRSELDRIISKGAIQCPYKDKK